MSKKKEKGPKKSPTPKKDPTQLLHEKIEEKLAITRQCLSCINKKIELKTLQDKMGSAMIREDQNPDEPESVSFEYPSAALMEQLSFLANSLVSGGKGILALDEFVDKVPELLACIQLTSIDLEEDDRPTETRAENGPMIRSCVDPWKTEQKNTRNSSEVDEKNDNDNPPPQEQEITEKKRKYIELLLTTADLGTKISGILISNPGTLKFKTDDGLNFDELINGKGMIFGTFLDLDTHLSSLGECTLLGLDNLGKRIVRKRAEGYQFLQIRCCFEINGKCPTPEAVYENCRVMGRFSCISQANKVVPILCLNFFACNNESLQFVREMVNPGPNYPCPLTLRQIAMATITTLNRSIPTAIPGIIFTPGKYEESDFLLILNEANKRKGKGPWSLNFFYGNYYEDGVLKVWEGSEAKIKEGQAIFLSKIQEYSRASMGLFQMMGGLPVEYILQLHYVDESVDPCENFYDFACGNFEKYHPLPQERDVWDNFYILQNQTHELVINILEESIQEHDSTPLQKAKTAYAACMDLNYIDQQLDHQDIELIRKLKGWPLVEDIENEKVNFTLEDIAKITSEYGVEFLLNFQIIPNLFDSFENVLYITGDKVSAPGIFKSNMETIGGNLTRLPFEGFLINVAEKHRNAIFSLKSPGKILEEIHEVVDFIETLEKGGHTNDSYGASAVIETMESLQKWTNAHFGHTLQLNWLNFVNIIANHTGTIATNSTKIMLGSRSSLYGILKLVEKTPPYILKNFVISRLLLFMAPDGNEELRYYFEQLYKEKKWTLYKRPEYCVQKLLNYPNGIGLSYALLMPFYATFFNTRNIEMIKEVIENLFETFIELLYESDWLDERTRKVVIEKVYEMDLLLAFPELIRNETFVESYYKNLQISLYDHFGNSQKLRAFDFAQKLSQMSKPRDRKLWTMSPLEANAYYTAQSNRIQLPLAILNPIFFNGLIQPLDYGRLGMVIGHEIIHGFDSQGRLYDKYGSYVGNWWSPNAMQLFSDKQNCFVNQYGKYYIPEISQNVSSVRTVRENIADNGGLRIAYHAFKNLPTPFNLKYGKYTMEQLFFIGFGTMWCSKEDTQHLELNNAQGTYVTNRFRVIGTVSNMEEFGEAFNCPLGSTMNPENKCILW